MGRIVAIRHGETDWSRTGRHTSRTDLALTPEGRAAAVGIGRRLANHAFVAVLCSPRRRARETAEVAGFGDRAVVDDDLVEWDYGRFEGLTTVQIRVDQPAWTIWSHPVPGGETAAEVAARADRVIAKVRARDGDVAVFAHAHLLRVLAARWIGLHPAAGRHFALSTASISVLGWQREDAVLELWNDSSHLDPGARGDWDRADEHDRGGGAAQ
jgi:probable phosphoglycerate mutase